MKKSLLILFLFCLSSLMATSISESRAKAVAKAYLIHFAAGNNPYSQATDLSVLNNPAEDGFYIFGLNGRVGFIMVSGDDAAFPVLGYSLDNAFSANNVPIQFKKWTDNYSDQLEYIRVHNIQATAEIRRTWYAIEYGNPGNMLTTSTTAVSPLITTVWDQGTYYNALCPFDNSYAKLTVTGCVATAMAQILKYHNFPAKGTGFHSYNHPKYGTLSANFGSTTYNWGSMVSDVTSANSAVATLMYHCGVSVDMNYGVGEEGGSGAYPNAIPGAFTSYFGYDASAQIVNRSSYTEANWIAMLKTEFDNARPVEYHGFGNGGGHSFVCDGYDNTNKFHFNWGWNGLADGYYTVNALNPADVGYGGGLGSYNSNQGVVRGIKPPGGGGGGGSYSLQLNSELSLNPSTINYQTGTTLSCTIRNTGTGAFSGELSAAIFNSSGTFVEYVESKSASISANTNYSASFMSAQVNAQPGTYTIYVYSRLTGGNWTQIANGSFTNSIQLTVVPASVSGLELGSPITPLTATQNASFNISTSITNNSVSSYSGYYTLDLYDSEGSWLEELDRMTGTIGASNTIGLPFTGTITHAPGNYIVAVWASPDGSTGWQLVGNTYYSNPASLVVQETAPSADVYESNNTYLTAYSLSPYATNAYDTEGSNLHIGNDLDYYEVDLPTGSDYSINARLQDSYSSDDGNTYGADAMFSYNIGSGYSSSYDDVLPNYIHVEGGGTVQFLVAPYFTGEVGSYLLDMVIYEGIVDNTLDPMYQSNVILFYPNPTSGSVQYSIPSTMRYTEVRVYNAVGGLVYRSYDVNGELSLDTMADGMYSIELLKETGYSDHAKISIQK